MATVRIRQNGSGKTAKVGGVRGRPVSVAVGATPPAVTPYLDDDFSAYADRAALLDVGVGGNPWTAMNQAEAFVAGEFIFLDASPPSGATSAKAMRYDHGSIADCVDNVSDTGGGARKLTTGSPTELWAEFRVYPENWTSTACGFFGYKLFFLDYQNSTRTDLNWVGQGMQGSLGPGASNVFTGGNSTKLDFADFVDVWTTVRWHVKLPTTPGTTADGVFQLWIDGELVSDISNETMNAGPTHFTQLRVGANLNNMTFNNMRSFWDYVRLYNTNPGWI